MSMHTAWVAAAVCIYAPTRMGCARLQDNRKATIRHVAAAQATPIKSTAHKQASHQAWLSHLWKSPHTAFLGARAGATVAPPFPTLCVCRSPLLGFNPFVANANDQSNRRKQAAGQGKQPVALHYSESNAATQTPTMG